MRELATYSIETDRIVLLVFVDGRRQRVPIAQLEYHLLPADLAVVNNALNLRHSFLKSHMPKAALALAAGGLLASITLVGRPLAGQWLPHTSPSPAPDSTSIVRSVTTTEPAAGRSGPSPSATPVLKRPTPKNAVAKATKATKPKPLTAPSPARVSTVTETTNTLTPSPPPVVTPTPSATPDPIAIASPSPAPNTNGQVLGDSTEPSPTPAP